MTGRNVTAWAGILDLLRWIQVGTNSPKLPLLLTNKTRTSGVYTAFLYIPALNYGYPKKRKGGAALCPKLGLVYAGAHICILRDLPYPNNVSYRFINLNFFQVRPNKEWEDRVEELVEQFGLIPGSPGLDYALPFPCYPSQNLGSAAAI